MKRLITQQKIIENYTEKFNEEVQKIKNIPKIPKFTTLHIGSTSIKNSVGEDILDILLVVDNLHEITNFDEKRLNNISYHRVEHNLKGVITYCKITNFLKMSYDTKVFIVQKNSNIHKQFIEFNNLLVNNKNIFKKYQNFKKNNIQDKISNKKLYNKNKEIFIKKQLKEVQNV